MQIMKTIPVVPAVMLQQYGLMLHYCVNGEKLTSISSPGAGAQAIRACPAYYLSRKFRQEMGASIGTNIKYVREERAKLMLVTTALPIAQIADSLRFASLSHFSETFREIAGKTPQQYSCHAPR